MYKYTAQSLNDQIQSIIDDCCYAMKRGIVDEKFKQSARRLHERIRIPSNIECNPHEITHIKNKISLLKRILENVFQ